MDDSSLRTTGWAGIGFVVLWFVSFGLAPGPSMDSSTAKIASYYSDHAHAILWGSVIAGVATLALLWFLGGLYVALVDGGAGRRLPTIGLVAGVLWIASWWVCCGAMSALAYGGATSGSEPVVRALWDFQNLGMALGSLPQVGLMSAVAVITLRGLALPRWYGWLSALTALLALASTLQIVITDTSSSALMLLSLLGFMPLAVWVLVGGVVVLRGTAVTRVRAAIAAS